MRFHFQLWHSVCLCHSRDKGPSAWASSPSPIPVSGKQDRRHVQYKTHRSTNLQDTFLHIIHLHILLPSGVFLDSTILTHQIVVLTHWRGTRLYVTTPQCSLSPFFWSVFVSLVTPLTCFLSLNALNGVASPWLCAFVSRKIYACVFKRISEPCW